MPIVFPAAFGRLCVETRTKLSIKKGTVPAAFGRLCVETATCMVLISGLFASRLRAAVC